MFVEIDNAAYNAAITSLTPTSGGDLFGGGTFLEHGTGGISLYRTEIKGGVCRYFEFIPTAK